MPIRETENPDILSMKGVHLYHFSRSNCAMRVRLLLEEKNIPWVDHYVDLYKQENLTEEYLEINPKGLVPAIVHDGTIVVESADILLYLEENFLEPAMIPSDPTAKAEMDELLEFTRAKHVSVIKTWVYGTTGVATKTKESMEHYESVQKDQELLDFHRMTLSEGHIPKEKIQVAEDTLVETFAKLDANLARNEWILGDQMTLADIAWIPQYALLQRDNFPFEQFPHFMAWVNRWKQRPSYKEAIVKYLPGAA